MPKADATGLAPEKSAPMSPVAFSCRGIRVFALSAVAHSFGDASERRPWAIQCEKPPAGRSNWYRHAMPLYGSQLEKLTGNQSENEEGKDLNPFQDG